VLPSLSFEPSGPRAAAIDRQVRERLAESLRHVIAGLASQGVADSVAAERVLQTIESSPMLPAVFALYSDLVEAVYANDFARAECALNGLMQPPPAATSNGPRIVTLDEAGLGRDQPARYLRFVDDPLVPVSIEPLARDELRSASALAAETLNLLDDCAPDLAAELRNLIREIVFVGSEPDAVRSRFQGASTFYLWGAMFLNAASLPDRVRMAQGLTHEGAHSLLFGFTFGAPLVENDAEERYPSPLREDLRPMEGVVHATFVLARMEYCVQQLLRRGRLTEEERSLALVLSQRNQESYCDGAGLIAKHARFTPTGAAVMQAADAYMRERMRSPAPAH
jgi:HEXXH motif-containing protein